MNNKRGFTIIELIVVIAIIAILAAIVLVNVTQYITKGRDAAAKGDLATIITNAAVFYDNSSKYDGFLASPSYTNVTASLTAMAGGGYTVTATCDGTGSDCGVGDNTTAFCASLQLKFTPTIYYCVDTSGAKKESATAICAAGVCPN